MKCLSMVLACYLNNYMPPAEYDFEPRQRYQIIEVSTATVKAACHMDTLSCAKPYRHQIIISNELTGEFRSIILKHEKAHFNGWVHSATDANEVKGY